MPLAILAIAAVIVFEVYKKDFERWCRPLADWLQARKAWSWVIPVGILVVLSFPPLFGHEIVYIVVGVSAFVDLFKSLPLRHPFSSALLMKLFLALAHTAHLPVRCVRYEVTGSQFSARI